MKKINLLVILLAFLLSNLNAQVETTVTETAETIGDISGSALHVRIHRATKRDILKKVKSYLKERSDEVKSKGDEVYATDVLFPTISENRIKVYAKVKEYSQTEHELYLIFVDGDQIVSTKTDIKDYNSAKASLYELANTLSRESNESFIEYSEKELRELEKYLDRLRYTKEKDENKIVSLGKKINDNEKDLKKVDDKENLDEKSIKTRAKKEKEILDYKKDIKELEKDLVENKKEQDEYIKKIKEQREVIKAAQKDKELFD